MPFKYTRQPGEAKARAAHLEFQEKFACWERAMNSPRDACLSQYLFELPAVVCTRSGVAGIADDVIQALGGIAINQSPQGFAFAATLLGATMLSMSDVHTIPGNQITAIGASHG